MWRAKKWNQNKTEGSGWKKSKIIISSLKIVHAALFPLFIFVAVFYAFHTSETTKCSHWRSPRIKRNIDWVRFIDQFDSHFLGEKIYFRFKIGIFVWHSIFRLKIGREERLHISVSVENSEFGHLIFSHDELYRIAPHFMLSVK